MNNNITISSFHVVEKPYFMCSPILEQMNIEFIKRLDSKYYDYIATRHRDELGGPNSQQAAAALRMSYYHGIESLLSLIGATIQAPDCIIGWLPRCENNDLRDLIRHIENGSHLCNRLGLNQITWDTIAQRIFRNAAATESMGSKMPMRFARFWQHIARVMIDTDNINEYNSLKHGLRIMSGGTSAVMDFNAGKPSIVSENIQALRGGEFGNTFIYTEKLEANLPTNEKPLLSKHHFKLSQHSVNWNPAAMVRALLAIGYSVHNMRTFLLKGYAHLNINEPFQMPNDLSIFEEAWVDAPQMSVFKVGHEIRLTNLPVEKNINEVIKEQCGCNR